MKKFIAWALALALLPAWLFVPVRATDFKDFTDREEIHYPDAVQVLNRLGIIIGYDDGSFRPELELSRGSAAKIIVSLLLGSDAARTMPNEVEPYPDVYNGYVFAGVIQYCKTSGLIDGYADGTFQPKGVLTGFAFAKMLLGVLGYDNARESFSGEGWTLNVTRAGHAAGLFEGFTFQGGEPINRETACQMVFNTLKASMVRYD